MSKVLVVTGPGGVGKSCVEDGLISPSCAKLPMFRLRKGGPRNSGDSYYSHTDLKDLIIGIHTTLGAKFVQVSNEILWCRKTQLAFLKVRDEWQLVKLVLNPHDTIFFEVYAPRLVEMLQDSSLAQVLTPAKIVILNPVESVANGLDHMRKATYENCKLRGDTNKSIDDRVSSIDVEASAWKTLIRDFGALEVTHWPFLEYRFQKEDRKKLLVDARSHLVEIDAGLEPFLRSKREIIG